MYYLEDHHPKEEYTLYCQVKGGCPYIGIWHGENMMDVQRKIEEIESRHNRYRQHYYIDNDFYNNNYNNSDYVYYYKFMSRDVNDWHELKTQTNIIKFVL